MTTPGQLFTKPIRWAIRKIARRVAPRFLIGITAILFDDDGRVYVQRHRFWPRQAFGFPGGYLARGETCEEAALREVREETGLTATDLTLLGVDASARDHQNLFYLGRIRSKEGFRLQRLEVLEGRFVEPDDLPEPFLKAHGKYYCELHPLIMDVVAAWGIPT